MASTRIDALEQQWQQHPKRWLVTGGAGFIGSHLVHRLVELGQHVVVLDNLATGHIDNLRAVKDRVQFVQADLNDADVMKACAGADVVLHQAALGSVPRSLHDPMTSHRANVDGFVRLLDAARQTGVKRFVYASSSSVYGDHPALPKVEQHIGMQLSPYAATKRINEIYAQTFQHAYGIACIGLRYFNVFGPRQDPNGPYAAVIPKWIAALLSNTPCIVNGDGSTSRDFCAVKNAVQANLLAAGADDTATAAVYNVACGARTTLLELFAALKQGLVELGHSEVARAQLQFADFRVGDVQHSLADISRARDALGYLPSHDLRAGLAVTLAHASSTHPTA